jgi:hypothetical protein
LSQLLHQKVPFGVAVVSTGYEPTTTHLEAAKRIVKYLWATRTTQLKYSKQTKPRLQGFADADWAGDDETRKSVSGFCFTLSGAAITWTSSQQSVIALSSCEAEYVALSTAAQQAIYLKNLMDSANIQLDQEPITILEDNQSCITLANDWIFRKRSKHMEVRYHFVRHQITEGKIKLLYCPTEEMIADTLTKPLEKQKFNKFKSALLGQEPSTLGIEGGC